MIVESLDQRKDFGLYPRSAYMYSYTRVTLILRPPGAGKSHDPFYTTPPVFMGYRVMKQRFYALTLGTSRFLFSGIGWSCLKWVVTLAGTWCRHLVRLVPKQDVIPIQGSPLKATQRMLLQPR